MKKIILAAFILPLTCFAQTPQKTLSKIEGVSAKSGVLIKKIFTDLGKIKSVEFQILEITDLSSNITTKGLRIETPETGQYSSGSATAFIDEDEIDGLLKALNQFMEITAQAVPDNDVEYVFTSKTGFKAFLFNYKKKWQFNIQVDKYNSRSQPYWDGTGELSNVIELIKKAKAEFK